MGQKREEEMNEPNTYELVPVETLPARASSGGRKSKFAIVDTMPVGMGFHVDEKDIGAARSYVRGRSALNPLLNIQTRRVTSGPKAGSFLVARMADHAPVATPTAESPAS